ncbi:DMT family transporter [Streptococcus oralis]|uniref:EamA family transporter n=1 Tax=Streptococcus oralis subsp. dentisani TaxID=1458253 RepID=A0A1X1ISD9_STROR|nr:DMT family transporter [Streptococcus oralis]ORO76045.1 EamA family transporter [Streptococcus oralis subsp. dentisani]
MNEKTKVYLAALSFSAIIGFSFLFTKIALGYASPLTNLAHRYTIAALVMGALYQTKLIKVSLSRKDILSILSILPMSLFYPLLFFIFQSFSLQYISSSEAGILQALVPIFTLLLASVFLKEKTSLLQKFFLFLSVAGVVFIFLSKGANFGAETASLGFLLMLGSVLANAINNILSKSKGGRYRAMDMTAVVIFVGFITFNMLSLTSHYLDGNILAYVEPLGQLPYLLSILYLGILASIVTGSLSIYAIVRLGASTVSVFGNLGTVLTILAGALILHEPIYSYHVIGATLIIAGILGMNLMRKK